MCSCRTQKRPAFPGYSRSNESGNSGTGPSTICGAAKPVQFSAIEALSRSFGQFFCLLYCRKGFREESTCGQPRCTQISTTRSLTVRTIVKQVVVTDFSGCGNTKELARYVLKRRRRASKKPGVERSGAPGIGPTCGEALKERESRLWKWNSARANYRSFRSIVRPLGFLFAPTQESATPMRRSCPGTDDGGPQAAGGALPATPGAR